MLKSMSADAALEYQARRARARRQLEKLQSRIVRMGNLRLLCAATLLVTLWFSFGNGKISPAWNWAPAALFASLAFLHAWLARSRRQARAVLDLYEGALKRMRDEWASGATAGDRFANPEHLYSSDLDIFGKGSLFQFLSCARTALGEETLAEWLLGPAGIEEARARQEAVQELAALLDLRESAALLADTTDVHSAPLLEWCKPHGGSLPAQARAVALLIAAGSAITAVAFLEKRLPLSAFAIFFALSAAFQVALRRKLPKLFTSFEAAALALENSSKLLTLLERESFRSSRLRRLSEEIQAQGEPASRRIGRLKRWIDLLSSTDHILLRALNPVLLLREQATIGIYRWREANGELAPAWLQAIGDFEALSSLAWLSYERPRWTFPRLIREPAEFRAAGLGHPLLPETRSVLNDVELGNSQRLLIVSGSNMSGKSTLLRAVGLAAVMAWAGAPVPATDITVSDLRVGASLRAGDSLLDNRSRFFAEITRVRGIVEASSAESRVLFLLDELLSGTNSHDRRIGAAGVLETLLARGAVGMITTHDLALAELESEFPGIARNAHFEDEMRDGRIAFDFKLRPGIVTRGNALALMRAIGLNVKD